ncbi:MAG TPA: protein kinase [Planctomycetaceae bacterium]|jgi:serine/threonine protein kinase/Leucine-rich repeat (LRR) protein|nr:protein kinase [Planctomycetaceae bacterium]
MAEPQNCPSRDELQRMVLGQLPDPVAEKIRQHLERCLKCWSALEHCVNSDELLEAVRASRGATCEPTKTLYLPLECLRGALATWGRAYDTTQSDRSGRPFSMTEISRQLAPPQSDDEIGRLGEFRVLRVLGVGGFAVVFEAEDIHLKRHVALKLMHPFIAARQGGADRFLREAQSAAALKHEHVVTIYQVGMHGETPFIALELLHGETLEDHLVRESRLSVQEVVRIGREIASGLAAAQSRGLLHRDIKPANIFLEGPEKPIPGESVAEDRQASDSAAPTVEPGPLSRDHCSPGKVKILDFGCAKSWADESAVSERGLLIGTPAYMAPEQLSGDAIDPRADLFSLGCLLYRMAAGKRPFGGSNLFALVRALALEDPTPLEMVNPEVPHALSDLVDRLLSKCPDDRPETAQIVVHELRAIEQGLPAQPVAAKTSSSDLSSDAGAGSKRGKKWTIGAGLGLALVLPLVAFFFGGQLIRVATNKGQIVIEVDDPAITLNVKEDQVVIHDGQGQAEITLAAGDHQLEVTVKQASSEAKFKTDKFTLRRGDRKAFEAREELAKAVASLTPIAPKRPETRPIVKTPKDQKPRVAAGSDLDRSVASWVLEQGGMVNVRVGQSAQPILVQPGNALPASDFKLTTVNLQKGALTDADLVHFRGLKQLVELVLSGKQIKGPGLANLADVTELKSLILWNTSVTDGALKHVEGLTKLEFLSLDGAQLTDAGLVHITPLKNLRELNLNWAPLTGAGFAALDTFSQLEVLYLRGNSLTDAALVHLGGLKNLRTLYLSGQPVTDAGLAQLGGLGRLQVLEVDSTKLTDAGLAQLKDLKNLRELNLSWTHVTDAGLKRLEEDLPQLQSLYLRGLYLSDAGMVHFRGFKSLGTLYLSGQPVTDSGLVHIMGLNHLMGLGLSSTRVTDAGFTNLPTLKNLRNLNLERTQVTDAVLAHMKGLAQLEDLSLGGTRVTDAGLAGLQALKNLRVLSLKGAQLTDSVVPQLLKLRSLTEIDLSGTRLSARGYAALKTGLPGLVRIAWTDANAAAAKAILAAGGTVEIRPNGAATNRSVTAIAELPSVPFQIASASLAGAQRPIEAALTALGDPRVDGCVSLNLSGTAISAADWLRLKGLTHLHRLLLEGNTLSDADLARLGGLTNLEDVSLQRAKFSESGLSHLRGLTRLTSLALHRTGLTDAGLSHIAGLKALKDLNLNNTAVTDAGLAHVVGLTELRSLVLEATRVSDAGLKQLLPLTKLESLWLGYGTQVTDAGVGLLRQLKNLRELALSYTQVTDAGLAQLEDLTRLEALWMPGTLLTDAGLAHLRAFKKLRILNLSHQPVTDAGLINLQTLSDLRQLILDQTRLTDAGLAPLKGLTRLSLLDVGQTQVTEAGLADIQGFKNLRVLGLNGLARVTDRAIPRFLHLPSLRSLDLRDTHVSARGFEVLKAASPNLSINWSEPNVLTARAILAAGGRVDVRLDESGTERSVKAIGELPSESFQITRARLVGSRPKLNELLPAIMNPRLEELVSLDLTGTMFDDADLERLKPLVAIRELNLAHTRITDAGLASLKGLTALRQLNLDGDAVRGTGLMHLQDLSELTELRLGCSGLTDLFLVELAGLKKLDRLSLAKSSISDEGVTRLAPLTHLKELDLSDTYVTADRVAKLKTSLPQCRIVTTAAAKQLAAP